MAVEGYADKNCPNIRLHSKSIWMLEHASVAPDSCEEISRILLMWEMQSPLCKEVQHYMRMPAEGCSPQSEGGALLLVEPL